MEQLIWKSIEEIDSLELFEILRLRSEVFIMEQRCIYPECDDHDREALHLQYLSDGILTGYLRLIPLQNLEYSVGRVVVRFGFRRQGLGQKLLAAADVQAQKLGAVRLRLNAQVRYRHTYQRAGYSPSCPPFDEEGILHLPMQKKL
jgi:ElaA protein